MRRTKSTMAGWTKTGKNEYTHEHGHKVTKAGWLWQVSGPNRNDGYAYERLWVAMSAAAKTQAQFA